MIRNRAPTSKFLKVKCPDCGNEQVVFGRPATTILCQVCGSELARPSGGEPILKAEVVSELE
ncbi:MAG: 30S ribosomal protein S27e [Methanobacteriota archaeon]